MAHTKAGATTKLGRDSGPKYLGVKKYDGERVKTGNILVRQRGLRYIHGVNVRRGNDDTLYAIKDGTVKFTSVRKKRFDGNIRHAKKVNVITA